MDDVQLELVHDGAVWRAEIQGTTVTITMVRAGKERVTERTLPSRAAAERFVKDGEAAMRGAGFTPPGAPQPKRDPERSGLLAALRARLEAGLSRSALLDRVARTFHDSQMWDQIHYVASSYGVDEFRRLGAYPRALDALLRDVCLADRDPMHLEDMIVVNRWSEMDTYLRMRALRHPSASAEEVRQLTEADLIQDLGCDSIYHLRSAPTFDALYEQVVFNEPEGPASCLQPLEGELAKLERQMERRGTTDG